MRGTGGRCLSVGLLPLLPPATPPSDTGPALSESFGSQYGPRFRLGQKHPSQVRERNEFQTAAQKLQVLSQRPTGTQEGFFTLIVYAYFSPRIYFVTSQEDYRGQPGIRDLENN